MKMPKLKEAHLNRMKGEYAPIWMSDVDKRMNPISSSNYLQHKNLANIDISSRREKPNASKSIFHKREHGNDYTSTSLQKPVQVKTIKDNA